MQARLLIVVIAAVVSAALSLASTGCQKSFRPAGTNLVAEAASMGSPSISDDPETRGGALLWSQNCMRCHNLRNPNERSDREWDVIVHHMRVRANLTAEEHRLILRFLQSAN